MNRPIFNILVVLCGLLYSHAARASETDSLLHILDGAIENQETYIREKYDRIQLLNNILSEQKQLPVEEKFNIYNALYLEYRSFSYDSAFYYAVKQYELASQIDTRERIARAKLNLTFVLRSSGRFKEAFDSLRTIHSKQLPDTLAAEYFEEMSRAYYDLAAYNANEYYSIPDGMLGNHFADSALKLYAPKSLNYFRLGGLRAEANQNHTEAIFMFQSILEKFDVNLRQYAMACYSIGKINQALGKDTESLDMIIRAATADLKASVKESVALMELAQFFYKKGEIDRAYRYIRQAANDANFYGARHRKLQVSSILPAIESAKLASVEYESQRRLVILLVVSLVAVLIVGFAAVTIRQFRQLRQTKQNLANAYEKLSQVNEKLLEANTIKEEYIGQTFTKDTEYLDKLDKFRNDINKKLQERKYDDLQSLIRLFSIKREKELLFVKFDEIFLKLFPNFVPFFNSLFKEEDRFELKGKSSFPIELRIFALIRIGITDHEQIASILGYSVRTIYNYKTKIKSKSLLSNEDFESELMKLKTFELDSFKN